MEVILIIILSFITGLFTSLLFIDEKIIKKVNSSKNHVRFFVKAIRNDMYWLYIKDKKGNISFIGLDEDFNNLWGLNPNNFADMKKGEIREVFLNLED